MITRVLFYPLMLLLVPVPNMQRGKTGAFGGMKRKSLLAMWHSTVGDATSQQVIYVSLQNKHFGQ